MNGPSPFPLTVLRTPAPEATCSCEHWLDCGCRCHGRDCDPSEDQCDIGFLADDGGLTRWGCERCTPGAGAPHDLGCELIGWSIPYIDPRPVAVAAAARRDDGPMR